MNFSRLTPSQSADIRRGYVEMIELSRKRRSAFTQAQIAVSAFLSRVRKAA